MGLVGTFLIIRTKKGKISTKKSNRLQYTMNDFENKNYLELNGNPDYQAWVQANCESSCPDGERKEDFSNRICAAFSKLVDEALAEGKDRLVILAHGGTQMAAMERYGVPHQDYYKWCGPNAGGYVLDAKDWTQKHILTVIKTVQYTKSAAEENP